MPAFQVAGGGRRGAAAAVLLTVGAKFLFRDAWPGSSLENNTGSVIRKSLRDGTQLARSPRD